jgi:hypothetical protein
VYKSGGIGWLRYTLFALLFVFVILGLVLHSYPLLLILVIAGIVLAVIADKLENASSEPFKHHNQQHHRLNH